MRVRQAVVHHPALPAGRGHNAVRPQPADRVTGPERSGPGPSRARLVPALDGRYSVRYNLPLVDPDRAGDGWSVLADATRRAIVSRLADGPLAVGQLAAGLPVSRPAVSQHLKILKDAGLVSERAAGTRRVYRLNPVAVAALRDQLDAFWQRALASYADVAEQVTAEEGTEESS